ncbi:MAG TPA: hypothetical protein VEY51_10715 [Chondromyces sp.]|nr:hypothetical protein [Chondromyces sp.]
MLRSLSPGVKISITRSITKVFEQYMAKIKWDEKSFSMEGFLSDWRVYITQNSSWYEQVDDQVKADPAFHEELAAKINEVVDKVLTEPPSEEQVEKFNELQKEAGTSYEISCKAEAKYYIDLLTRELKKKKNY